MKEIFIFLIIITLGTIYPTIAFEILKREENLKLEEEKIKNKKISLIYLYSIFMTAISYILIYYKLREDGYLPIYIVINTILILASITDLRWQLIPDSIILFGIFIFFPIGIFMSIDLKYKILNGIIIFLAFYLFHRIYSSGFGGGDVKIIGLLGLYLGIIESINILTYSSFIGIIYLILKKLKGIDIRKYKLPFIPFIHLGLIVFIILQ